ncbi:MAG: AzlD domain-containing protein [Gammaproteobacteria bacterium]|nr:AzlD domain-containing protein [Gammaproteobacteria bacterium]
MNIEYLLIVIAIMSAATFATRLPPFVLFSSREQHPLLQFIAKYTPPMVMSVLVIYMLKSVDHLSAQGLYAAIALAVTIAVHLWRRNALMSIVAGTATFMACVQKIFFT